MNLPSKLFMSVAQAAVELAESERADVTLDGSHCLHSLDKSSDCAICEKACPVNAISFEAVDGRQVVTHDGETCVKCGLCLRVCPVEAYTGDNGVASLLEFVYRQDNQGIVELACALHPNIEQGPSQVHLVLNTGACLAALGPSAIMALLTLGVAHVVLRVDYCHSCPLAESRSEIDFMVTQLENLLARHEELGSPVTLLEAVSDDLPSRKVASIKAPPKSRRDFFRTLTTPEALPEEVQLLMLPRVSDAGKHPPSERLRLIRALKSTPKDWHSSKPLGTYQTAKISADDKCTACGVCDRACPTGAIRFNEQDGERFTLTFDAGSCTTCGLCITYCEPRALSRDGFPSLYDWMSEEPLILRSGLLKYCSRCGATFAESLAGDLCPLCDFRKKQPFGSRLPDGFQRQRKTYD